MQESPEALEKRIAALERAITEDEGERVALADGAATAERVEALEARLDDLTDRVAELEAATQALRGYVGNVRSVNREVEQRADAALAKAESLEAQQGQRVGKGEQAQQGQRVGKGEQAQQGEKRPEKPGGRGCPRCGRGGSDGADSRDADRNRENARRETRIWREDTMGTAAEQGARIRDGTDTARAVAFDGAGSNGDREETGTNTETGGVIRRVRDLL